MKSKVQGTNEKRVFVKSYSEFMLIEKAVKILKQHKSNHLQIAILGKILEESNVDKKKLVIAKDIIKARCKVIFENPKDFGVLLNPEIGYIFIAGFLVSTFLQKVEKKTIGSMTTGPYGILRGLGIDRDRTAFYIKEIQQGNYILILRGYESELNKLAESLANLF